MPWFVGYTPELTAAIWLGYENTDRDHFLTTSSSAAAAVFQQILSRALVDQPIIPFPVPDDMKKDPDKKPDKSEKGKGEDKGKGKDKGKK